MTLEEFKKDQFEALNQEDESKIKTFMKKYNIPISSDPLVFQGAIHKARTALTSLPLELRIKSKQWLNDMKWSSWDDGDLNA